MTTLGSSTPVCSSSWLSNNDHVLWESQHYLHQLNANSNCLNSYLVFGKRKKQKQWRHNPNLLVTWPHLFRCHIWFKKKNIWLPPEIISLFEVASPDRSKSPPTWWRKQWKWRFEDASSASPRRGCLEWLQEEKEACTGCLQLFLQGRKNSAGRCWEGFKAWSFQRLFLNPDHCLLCAYLKSLWSWFWIGYLFLKGIQMLLG